MGRYTLVVLITVDDPGRDRLIDLPVLRPGILSSPGVPAILAHLVIGELAIL